MTFCHSKGDKTMKLGIPGDDTRQPPEILWGTEEGAHFTPNARELLVGGVGAKTEPIKGTSFQISVFLITKPLQAVNVSLKFYFINEICLISWYF